MTEPFSVCMSIYHNDKADDFISAIRSIYAQTCRPTEIILVKDGPVSAELEQAVDLISTEIPILRIVTLKNNVGHAGARQAAMEAANNELIAIMDSDDIAEPNRFDMQLDAFSKHPRISVIGGQIKEFVDIPENIVGERIVPVTDDAIKVYLKSRCPMNLVTVMYRKSDVQSVGGFIDWFCEEDYYLWIRMAIAGYRFANLPDTLVNVRVGKEMYQRRGGWQYFRSEAKLQTYMFKHRLIGFPRYIFNVSVRFVIQVALPNSIRGYVFKKLFRK